MNLPNYFISCDWGTSNFRLRLVRMDSLEIIEELITDQGIKVLFGKYQNQNKRNQKEFYLSYLKGQIQMFPLEHRKHLVVSSGMSTSNMGLRELPYAKMPFDKNGDSFVFEKMPIGEGQDLLLISGVQNKTTMMRGEEVQAIGLENDLSPYIEGVLVLPGTHSKHISYRAGQFYDLKNYMTGELFEVLIRKSILSNSILKGPIDTAGKLAFDEGLDLGLAGQLTSSLLKVRARHIVALKKKEENYFYLSGLLIGDELSYLKHLHNRVFLAAPSPVFGLYKRALKSFLNGDQLVLLDGRVLDTALLIGQSKIIRRYAK